MNANKADAVDDQDLVIASRTWFCLYLFEHQSVFIYFNHHSQPIYRLLVIPGYLMERDDQQF